MKSYANVFLIGRVPESAAACFSGNILPRGISIPVPEWFENEISRFNCRKYWVFIWEG